ncbi:hypothetical protein HV822_02035 [Halopseudomonas maritima]|nr:hypothetical protein HV822_02035 [Halopseudomonas maritima]
MAQAMAFQAAQAADGDIIIQRQVQSRIATRAPLLPDPNPEIVNPGTDARRMAAEMSDADFANVASGAALRGHYVESQITQGLVPNHSGSVLAGPQSGTQTVGGGGGGGGAVSGPAISGTINQSIKQGLGPLNAIGSK